MLGVFVIMYHLVTEKRIHPPQPSFEATDAKNNITVSDYVKILHMVCGLKMELQQRVLTYLSHISRLCDALRADMANKTTNSSFLII